MFAFNSHMRQNMFNQNLSESVKICWHVIVTQVSQPASAGKAENRSELQAHHVMTPELWTWFLCRMSVIPVRQSAVIATLKKIKWKWVADFSFFLENFDSFPECPGRASDRFAPSLADALVWNRTWAFSMVWWLFITHHFITRQLITDT